MIVCRLSVLGLGLAGLLLAWSAGAQDALTGPTFTTAQAGRGETAYAHSCRTCHGDNLDDGDFGGAPLRGSWFRDHWGVGDVAGLFAYAKTNMPPDAPGSLNDETYADIVAYILSRNDYKPGDRELPTGESDQQKMSLRR